MMKRKKKKKVTIVLEGSQLERFNEENETEDVNRTPPHEETGINKPGVIDEV